MTTGQTTDSPSNRGLRADLPTSYATYVDRWAIVVGISQYKDASINLKYADRDAEALYELLKTPTGGGFAEEHICKLVNEDATTANITRALRSFLKKPGKDDIVLLYFACHGAPDIDRPDILYLLTHDTDPKDIAGTALPMREINLSLKENLLAERVIIIADTCHSAGISKGSTRDTGDSSGAINLYLQEVGATQKGIALLTSAEAKQVSFEDEKWGGGHGVFTHFLLEGMKGAADRNPKNGIVTVGELFEYVRENVKRATNDAQHPCIGPDSFDRNLPIAVTAGISAQEHYELGCQLYQIGMRFHDVGRLQSAAGHLQEAIRLARTTGIHFTEAQLQLSLVLMNSGNVDEAIKVLKQVSKSDIPDAMYYLGIAYAKQKETEESARILESFLKQYPENKKASWVQAFISQQMHQYVGTKYALLIGINDHPPESGFHSLKGCLNDVQLMYELLVTKYHFPPENIKRLIDHCATYSAILDSLKELSYSIPSDTVLVFFSGHSIEPIEYEYYLVAHDSITPFNKKNYELDNDSHLLADNDSSFLRTITAQQLHDCINSIPANTTLILDTHANQNFIDLAETGKYTLLLSTSPGLWAYERHIDDKHYGFFTYSLVEQLRQFVFNLKLEELNELVTERIQGLGGKQQPIFIGDRDGHFLSPRNHLLEHFNFSQFQNYAAFTEEQLENQYNVSVRNPTVVFPELYQSLGKAFLEKKNYKKAVSSFQLALKQSHPDRLNTLFELGIAYFLAGNYSKAIKVFQQYLKLNASQSNTIQTQTIISALEKLKTPNRFALLVGINEYYSSSIPALKGAINDISALKEVLVEQYQFSEENIVVLEDKDATCANILRSFKDLVQLSIDATALFYFAGNGSLNNDGSLTILGTDSRQPDVYDIQLEELSRIAGEQPTKLISIIDAGWANAVHCPPNGRVAPPDSRTNSTRRSNVRAIIPVTRSTDDLTNIRSLEGVNYQIGCLSIYPRAIQFSLYENSAEIQGEKTQPIENGKETRTHGILTYALIESLRSDWPNIPTYVELVKSVAEKIGTSPHAIGSDLATQVFKDSQMERTILSLLRQIELTPVKQTSVTLKRLIEQRNGSDLDGTLNLAIIQFILGDYEASISTLESTLAQMIEQQSKTVNQSRFNEDYPEIHYWLGRLLYENKRDPARAVSELRLATQQNPANAAAHYYLGQALRSLMKQEFITEAERAFYVYLDSGAPLGHRKELQDFLRETSNQRIPVSTES